MSILKKVSTREPKCIDVFSSFSLLDFHSTNLWRLLSLCFALENDVVTSVGLATAMLSFTGLDAHSMSLISMSTTNAEVCVKLRNSVHRMVGAFNKTKAGISVGPLKLVK